MTFQHKAYKTISLLGLLLFFSTCIGQKTPEEIDKDYPKVGTLGTTVSSLEEGITVIFQDSQDNYWLGGGEKGVYKYTTSSTDKQGKSLRLYTIKDGLCSHAVIGIQEDKLGNIYFDTTDGICQYDGQKFTSLVVSESPGSNEEWKLEADDLWFRMGWNKNGPYRFDGQSLYHLAFPQTARGDAFYAKYPNTSYTPYGIYATYQDSQGRLWFGTTSLGICRYDGESLSWLYEEQLSTTPSGGDFGIRSIIEDKAGYFWFCNTRHRYEILSGVSEKDGALYMNYNRAMGVGFTNENNEVDYPYFLSMTEDDEGDLWMVTYDDGVWRSDGEKLIHYPIESDETEVLLFSIYKDRQGGLWLGTHNAGVYIFKGGKFEPFKP